MLILQTVTEYPWYVRTVRVVISCGLCGVVCSVVCTLYTKDILPIYGGLTCKNSTHTAFKTNIYVYVKLLKKSFKTF